MRRSKRITAFLLIVLLPAVVARAQQNDSTYLYLDSLFMELPEVLVVGERPVVKAEKGKLVYDLPRLVNDLPVNNAYEAIRELPGIVDMNGALTLAGNGVNIIINGKVSTLSESQLAELLKTIPVSRIEKAEVMYSASARYQVRGPVINLVLKKGEDKSPSLQGELFTSWSQEFYERLTERASLLFSSSRLSADLIYSYSHGRNWQGRDKEALHTVNGTVYPMETRERLKSRRNSHNIRFGTDFTIAPDNLLSLVYTTQFYNAHGNGNTTGTETSEIKNRSDDRMHNIKLDYQSSFGLSTGGEFTFYKSPGDQKLHSILNNEHVDARYEDEQRINKWRFYLTQSHALKKEWGINYGASYTTTTDNSFQYYFDTETGAFQPGKSMESHKREHTFNAFTGFTKNINSMLSVDASVAVEQYHTEMWNDWKLFPTLSVNYTLKPGHLFQFSFTTDRKYPSFWSVNNSVAYLSAYSEVHGNPDLKPSTNYSWNLTYIHKSKYTFTAFYSYRPDFFTQVLYQRPDELVEIYKFYNFDYRKQAGLQTNVPFRVKNRLSSRLTLVGYYLRDKDGDFRDIPYTRDKYSFIAIMNNTFTLSTKPDLKFTLSGFYQHNTIQGVYDLGGAGNVDTSLRWTSAGKKAQLTVSGKDLFETSGIDTKIRYKGQYVDNRRVRPTRTFEVSFSYKLGNYKEKKRGEVDTSRYK